MKRASHLIKWWEPWRPEGKHGVSPLLCSCTGDWWEKDIREFGKQRVFVTRWQCSDCNLGKWIVLPEGIEIENVNRIQYEVHK